LHNVCTAVALCLRSDSAVIAQRSLYIEDTNGFRIVSHCVRAAIACASHSLCIRLSIALRSLAPHFHCVRTAFALRSRFIRASFALRSRCVRASFALRLRFVRASFALRLRCVRTVVALHSHCVCASCRDQFPRSLRTVFALSWRCVLCLHCVRTTNFASLRWRSVYAVFALW
jgi:hypothetical protein